jgi:poly(3-hydroxybutyrate) depolymerase
MARYLLTLLFLFQFTSAIGQEMHHKLTVDGKERTYWIFVPEGSPPDDGLLCVLVLHWGS